MTDLRSLRYRGGQSVALTPGVRLYADAIHFADKRKRTGEALGHVFLDVGPVARYKWMVEYGYAGKATFSKRESFVVLADHPMLEREFLTQIATEALYHYWRAMGCADGGCRAARSHADRLREIASHSTRRGFSGCAVAGQARAQASPAEGLSHTVKSCFPVLPRGDSGP